MEKKEDLLKENEKKTKFLVKPINLLIKQKSSDVWIKFKKIVKIAAIVSCLISLLLGLFSLAYFWFLSSRGASLEKRAEQAKTAIVSLKKEEQLYLSLIKKLKSAEKTLNLQSNIAQFLKTIDLILPPAVISQSLTIAKDGETDLLLFCPSLTEVESLNESLKNALDQGKIASTEIGGLTKETDSYKLNLNLIVK